MLFYLKSSLKPRAGIPPGLTGPVSKNGSDYADRHTLAHQFAQSVFLPICRIGRLAESVENTPQMGFIFQL